MIGYVWADSPRATAAAVVTATDAAAGQAVCGIVAQAYRDARDALVFGMQSADLETALTIVKGVPAILADSGDNPTAGGVGDRADVLGAVLARTLKDVLFAGIADPDAFARLRDGARIVVLGGALGGGGPRVTLPVDGCRITDGCAVVCSGGVTVVVTQRRRPFHDLADFDALCLDLAEYELLVVKSGYLSPELAPLPRRQIMALTQGAVCQDFSSLENLHRPPGTWPFTTAARPPRPPAAAAPPRR